MFVPPYDVLLQVLRSGARAPRGGGEITMPRALLDLMLRLLVAEMPFDEAEYLKRNPDIAEALMQGKIADAHQHFITSGYFEGRVGGAPAVDAAWYQQRNADVASEVAAGGVASAADHYIQSGAREWRSPSAAEEALVAEWKRAASAPASAVPMPPVPLPKAYLDAMKRRG
jgi:hypothetical protein